MANIETSNTTAPRQYLTFCLGDENFAVDVAKVREILDIIQITRVPQMPDYMLGVINLRGSVVPVVDLRHQFGLATAEQSRDTCIVVLEVEMAGDLTVIGALVDSVQEVLDLAPDQIEPPPRMGMKLRTEFILGMGKKDEKFLILLDIDKIFSTDELLTLQGSDDDVA